MRTNPQKFVFVCRPAMSYSVNELTHGIIHQKELKVSSRKGLPSKEARKNRASISLMRGSFYAGTAVVFLPT
jgi:hypothetical protein